jgi:hypothetical protein
MLPKRARRAALLLFVLLLAACTGSAAPTSTPPPTQPLNTAQPTATAVVVIPTSTVTLPPAAGDLARTATAQAPTPDSTAQARAVQGRLALDTVSRETGAAPSALDVVSVTGVRAGREIDGCGRARSGMALAAVREGDSVTVVLIEGDTATICGTVNLYDDRPELFLEIDPVAAELTALAVERAARTAAVEADTVTIESVRPVQWDSETIVCDADILTTENAPDDGAGVSGYRIALTADEREFIYHTDFDRIIPCSEA